MTPPLRLLLDPLLVKRPGAKTGEKVLTGLRLRFGVAGGGQSIVPPDSTTPARIIFSARGVKAVREKILTQESPLATLEGGIQLASASGKVTFACDPDSIAKFVERLPPPNPGDPARPRTIPLSLILPPDAFTGLDPAKLPVLPLVLPDDARAIKHMEVLAVLEVAGQVEADATVNDVLDVPIASLGSFPVPIQKRGTLADVGVRRPILLASADSRFLPGDGSLRDKLREQHEKRGKDDSPPTAPGGDFIPFRMVTAATRPEFKLDHGFLDDGNGNLDLSKMESPTFDDFTSEAKWITMLIGAEILRPDLVDGTLTYRRFIEAVGGTMEFDYERFGAQDRTGRFVLESAIEDVREGAIELFDPRGTNPYTIQCGVIGVGASDENGILLNPRYGYPGTENWQKAIGAHTIWIEAKVAFAPDPTTGTQGFTIDMIIHVEDRYNFNPGQADAATGILDKENGRFEVTGQGKEFLSVSTLKRRIEFSMPSGPRVPRQKPPNEKITVPR